ncbi:MAG: hypothetical protein IJP68_12135 [Selenomonadaceae bacterium]|nr:hypothetical protein [Selenomonadaceae bacterium]
MAAADNLVKVSQFQTGLTRVKAVIDELDGRKLENITVSGNTIQFWTSDDTTGTPAYTVDFPEEIFLDQVRTVFVQSFVWSNATYPGSTNPNLDGKPVFVLAVKGDKETNPTLTFSFVNLEGLIVTYTAGDGISIAGTSIAVSLSANAGNILSIANDGLLGEMKVSGATQGNFATFGASGAIVDSGFTVASDSSINTMLDSIFGVQSGN